MPACAVCRSGMYGTRLRASHGTNLLLKGTAVLPEIAKFFSLIGRLSKNRSFGHD